MSGGALSLKAGASAQLSGALLALLGDLVLKRSRADQLFLMVGATLTWGKGLSLEQMADQEQAEQTERNEHSLL